MAVHSTNVRSLVYKNNKQISIPLKMTRRTIKAWSEQPSCLVSFIRYTDKPDTSGRMGKNNKFENWDEVKFDKWMANMFHESKGQLMVQLSVEVPETASTSLTADFQIRFADPALNKLVEKQKWRLDLGLGDTALITTVFYI